MATRLLPGFKALALKLQEASDLTSSDVQARLRDTLRDCYSGTGTWAYVLDYIGDGESGDVIYCVDGDTKKAPYTISGTSGAAVCTIDHENAIDVVPRTIYEVEADEGDHYAAMEESFKAEKLYVALPLYERFISKKERDAASADDFAGSGRSYPILKPEDVSAAARSIGRAGSGNKGPSALKASIIRIAKRKGWEKYLPKAWQTGASEANVPRGTEGVKLTEAAATLEPIVLKEARSDYEIRLISPGVGASAVYPREVLKRDGPKIFKAGTHVYLNHPTAAEESARPEGDVANLAGVLSTDAVYHESHPKGEGLYARMKVFADHAQLVEEKAPHVGMSIRASGVAESGKTQGGLPVLKELTRAESVDIVTRAGRDGKIFSESARSGSEEHTMTKEEQQALVREAVAPFQEKLDSATRRLVRAEAKERAWELIETLTLPKATKQRIVESALASIPLKEGELDGDKFAESVAGIAKREGEYLAQIAPSGQVYGMGAGVDPVQMTEAQRADYDKRMEREAKQVASLKESGEAAFSDLMGDTEAAKRAYSKGLN